VGQKLNGTHELLDCDDDVNVLGDNIYTVACTSVAMQRPRDKENKQRPFPRKRLSRGNEYACNNRRTVFSMQSVPRCYNQDSWNNE
jgi:hypothetical protein